MLLTTLQPRLRGFSLIELIVVLAIFALLAMAGVPTLFTFVENSKIRNAAQSFYAAAQSARAEAVRRNMPTQIVLTTDAPTAANVDTTNLSNSAVNWIVRVATPTAGTFEFVEGGSAANTSTRANGDTSITVAASSSAGAVNTVTFTPLSNTDLTQVATFAFTNPAGGACVAASGPMQCISVQISPGGRVHVCDPSVDASATGDTRRCTS